VTLEKAFLLTELKERIECQFNPSELTITKLNSWKAPPRAGGNAPSLTFEAGQSGTLALSLTLDTTHSGLSVTEATSKLLDLMTINPKLPGANKASNTARPQWVQFCWGGLQSFEAVVDRISIKFTYFSSGGIPLRAKADLSLKQFKDDRNRSLLQNPTSFTPVPHTVHRVVHGETLDRIAATHYADSTRWRLIAEANAVVDPLAIAAGALLVIPEIAERRRG